LAGPSLRGGRKGGGRVGWGEEGARRGRRRKKPMTPFCGKNRGGGRKILPKEGREIVQKIMGW